MEDSLQSIIDIKRYNLKNILNFLREAPCATKKEIAQALSLSFATVSNLCNEMEEQGYIESAADDSYGKVGRSPKSIRLKPRSCLLAAVDLHRSGRVAMRLYNLLGEVEAHTEFSYAEREIDSFLERFRREYQSAFSPAQRARVAGMGAAVSGIYDTQTGNIVASELPLFENRPLKRMLAHALALPVYIENETNLCAFGEAQKRKTDHLLYLYIGEGLGIGVISGGKGVAGQRGHAPEICHAPLGILDRPCPLCGGERCMQTDLSIYGFSEKFTGLAPLPGNHTGWECFLDALADGETAALEVAGENARILAAGISIAVNLFDPAVVAIGGIPAPLFHSLSQPIQSSVRQRRVVRGAPDITLVHDGDFFETVLHGTAEMAYSRWYPNIHPQPQSEVSV